jgi:diadenosine tetraphosphate (Ap4A) HIT family hydrolase
MPTKLKNLRSKISQSTHRKLSLPISLRTARDELSYLIGKKAGDSMPLIEEVRLQEWRYWALIPNKFPYSLAFKTHHMLIPKRQVTEADLSNEERSELREILAEVADVYDCHMTNFRKKQSIKGHYHIHLLAYKDERKELSL